MTKVLRSFVCTTRVQAGFDQLFDILFGKSLNDVLGKLGWGNFFSGVGQFELFVQPGVESAQSDVDVSQRFSRQVIRIVRSSALACTQYASRQGNW
jgi:hypothetical protein